jgi:acetyl esterase/lipase
VTEPKVPVLEAAASELAAATSEPPFLYQMEPDEGRKAVEALQAGDDLKPKAAITDLVIEGGPTATVRIRIVKPPDTRGPLPVILYVHGAGWVFGGPDTHDRLVRELAVGAHAAVVFPDYDRSPEARYPVALEQCWTAALWVTESGAEQGLESSSMVVAGDSVGGNMCAALTLLAKQRGGVDFAAQALFYPVTDANFDTGSYDQFAEGYYLTRAGMRWFFDQYTTDPAQRADITVSPLRADTEQLSGLPPALVITAEADVLRDEAEAYADHLRAAGVPVTAVRYAAIVHDFVMLDALRHTRAAGAAIALAVSFISTALGTSDTRNLA